MTFTGFLLIHIGAGVIAVLSGSTALLATKGEWLHRRAGKVFFVAMVCNTSASFGLAILRSSTFLFLIGVFSLYLVFAGWRAVTFNSPKARPIDWAASLTMLVGAIGMVAQAVSQILAGHVAANPALLAFGLIGAALAADDIRAFMRPLSRGKDQIIRHIGRMVGAMIAATTAFVVVNLPQLPQLWRWLGPSAGGSVLITYWIWRVSSGGLVIRSSRDD